MSFECHYYRESQTEQLMFFNPHNFTEMKSDLVYLSVLLITLDTLIKVNIRGFGGTGLNLYQILLLIDQFKHLQQYLIWNNSLPTCLLHSQVGVNKNKFKILDRNNLFAIMYSCASTIRQATYRCSSYSRYINQYLSVQFWRFGN